MLNEKGQRELVYVVKIDGIEPIDGADRVEIARVGGWKIMVRKGQFHPDDLAIYFEIDSRVPEREPFLFLEPKNYKIKTQKYFKGTVISQGLLMQAEDFGWVINEDGSISDPLDGSRTRYLQGTFLTEKLGVVYANPEDNARKASGGDRYSKMASRHKKMFKKAPFRWLMRYEWGRKFLFALFGKKSDVRIEWPFWVIKTDEERVQNIPSVLQDKSEWIATEKIDGTSTTVTLRTNGSSKRDYFVCSRNVVYDEKNTKNYYETNVYQEMAQRYHMKDVLQTLIERYQLEWVTLQGETYGEGIQKRDYGINGHDFRGFNLIFSDRGRLNSVEAEGIMKEFGIPWVPILDEHFILPDTVEELLEIATGKSVIDGEMREGIVFRSQDGTRSFKAVSNEFLLKYHA